jgi:hypothetical protein
MSYNADIAPPRVFSVVTSASVGYNMDFVAYLIQQETARRIAAGAPALTPEQTAEFQRQLIRQAIIKSDAQAAINLRPSTTRTFLQE